MAIFIPGVTTCSLCRAPVYRHQQHLGISHWFSDPDHKFYRQSDTMMHRACFVAWKDRHEFISALRDAGAEHTLKPDGTYREPARFLLRDAITRLLQLFSPSRPPRELPPLETQFPEITCCALGQYVYPLVVVQNAENGLSEMDMDTHSPGGPSDAALNQWLSSIVGTTHDYHMIHQIRPGVLRTVTRISGQTTEKIHHPPAQLPCQFS